MKKVLFIKSIGKAFKQSKHCCGYQTCVKHPVSQDRILPRLTIQWCWFVDWDTIGLIQTNLQNGNTASTSRPFGQNVSQAALCYDEHTHYSAPEIPIYITTRGLPPFAIHAVKICQTTPPRPCSTLNLVLQLSCSPCRRGGEYLWYKQVLVSSSVSNFGKWMLLLAHGPLSSSLLKVILRVKMLRNSEL